MIRKNMRIMAFFMLFIFSQFLNLAPLSANNWGLEKQKLEHGKCDSIILPLQWVFRTVPLTAKEWVGIGAITITIVIAVETDKWIRRKRGAK